MQVNQREVLKQRIGEIQANRALTHSYLSRGHLSPDADFLLGTWQDLSYFYINTAPQWQTINGGNWLRLENLIRNFAISVSIYPFIKLPVVPLDSLQVYTFDLLFSTMGLFI